VAGRSRRDMIMLLGSVVGSGGDIALGNDREGGEGNEYDLELSDLEWDGWMLDLDQQRYVERARAELGHK